MAPIELAFLAAITLYAYVVSRALGLHGDIPPAGSARARFYTQRILEILKAELRAGADYAPAGAEVSFTCGGERRTLFLKEAALQLRTPNGVRELHPLGERGRIFFSQAHPGRLDIEVVSEAEPGHLQRFNLTLPIGSLPQSHPLVFRPDGSRAATP